MALAIAGFLNSQRVLNAPISTVPDLISEAGAVLRRIERYDDESLWTDENTDRLLSEVDVLRWEITRIFEEAVRRGVSEDALIATGLFEDRY